MRIIMLGTGPFAVPTLRALHAAGHEVLLAVSRPPKGRKPLPAPVQAAAEEMGIPRCLPETVNSAEARAKLSDLAPDLLVVCDYGEILKSETLAVARFGGINLHGSLLPKYRGAAPVQWAMLNGDAETGNTVIQMTPGLDAGPCVGVDRVTIDPDETSGELESRLSERGARLVVDVVERIAARTIQPIQQDKSQATKAPRLTKEDGQVNWSQTALEIKNRVRALHPWPRAFTDWHRGNGEPLRLILDRVQIAETEFAASAPGTVVSSNRQLVVATGAGFLSLEQIQPAGKRIMSAGDFLRGYPVKVGDVLG